MNEIAAPAVDRREFFRINDRMVVSVHPITAVQADAVGQEIIDSSTDSPSLSQQLLSMQKSFNILTDHIGHTDREVARALRLLDDKLNLLAQSVQQLHTPIDLQAAIDVNLSVGGLALTVDRCFEPRSTLEVKMQLLPSGLPIHAVTKVIACQPESDTATSDRYYLRMAFIHMNDADRDILAKHILSRQAEELRSNKQS